ncbi:unnamed protein product [Pieris macdunnoughi]|uniref:Uncharacterized protein n=1 Tax=Pieris macdunnoughi TaxID=345717 RepID=A0A821NR91_9NEOP|nr:unnamed protein product [Pieris macdunnoughi]
MPQLVSPTAANNPTRIMSIPKRVVFGGKTSSNASPHHSCSFRLTLRMQGAAGRGQRQLFASDQRAKPFKAKARGKFLVNLIHSALNFHSQKTD